MEHAVFLVEETGEQIRCLLNPDSIVMRRSAGVVPQPGRTGLLGGRALPDDPVLRRGGGRTEVELALVFDVTLGVGERRVVDVRELTRPLWRLTEDDGQQGIPPNAALIWGKNVQVTGVVEAIAERLERFTTSGVPERSWVRCRMVRREATAPPAPSKAADARALVETTGPTRVRPGDVEFHEVVGGGPGDKPFGERLDEIAADMYGDPTRWRWIASANDVDSPPWPPAGTLLRVPGDPPTSLEGPP